MTEKLRASSFSNVIWELVLILASVLIFRSLWTLIDRVASMNDDLGLWSSLLIGTALASIALFVLNRHMAARIKRD